jgi:hypothetical protein
VQPSKDTHYVKERPVGQGLVPGTFTKATEKGSGGFLNLKIFEKKLIENIRGYFRRPTN